MGQTIWTRLRSPKFLILFSYDTFIDTQLWAQLRSLQFFLTFYLRRLQTYLCIFYTHTFLFFRCLEFFISNFPDYFFHHKIKAKIFFVRLFFFFMYFFFIKLHSFFTLILFFYSYLLYVSNLLFFLYFLLYLSIPIISLIIFKIFVCFCVILPYS
jgi:hypothetical protein